MDVVFACCYGLLRLGCQGSLPRDIHSFRSSLAAAFAAVDDEPGIKSRYVSPCQDLVCPARIDLMRA